jgi:hypothetical protein
VVGGELGRICHGDPYVGLKVVSKANGQGVTQITKATTVLNSGNATVRGAYRV